MDVLSLSWRRSVPRGFMVEMELTLDQRPDCMWTRKVIYIFGVPKKMPQSKLLLAGFHRDNIKRNASQLLACL
ncbi:MAG: hypothetical protein KGY69_03505, partial [Bacteroidales bacterium]|nr:hypothetical protein [Bacteroidales bacterium]